jgi:energy-coupling factor transporter ATP-binding protein EcfA2
VTSPLGPPYPIGPWVVPSISGTDVLIQPRAGEVVTVVGGNGAGKSALATWISAQVPPAQLKRILGHRKIWFQSSGPAISSADRSTFTSNMNIWDRDAASRYVDHADSQRPSIALFDLVGRMNEESRRVVALYDDGASRLDVEEVVGSRLLPTLNRVLDQAGLYVEIGITSPDIFFARHRTLGVEYPIFQMSDGERSALLLAAEVLTATPGVVILIDEPERHLHRAISGGLIEAVVAARPDCAFVVLTHDLDLADRLSRRPGQTISLSGVEWSGQLPSRWTIHEVPDGGGLSETARRAILGGRQKILFIEGDDESLDLPLYGALFTGWQMVPSGSCELVIRSVSGLRDSTDHHWIQATGLVDRDGRSEVECQALEVRGIHVLPVSEVENLYYVEAVLSAVAERQANTLGMDPEPLAREAKKRALASFGAKGVVEHLAGKLAKDEVARQLVAHMPDVVDENEVNFSFASPYPARLAELNELCRSGNYDELIRTVPIRNSGIRNEVAAALGFRSVADYQRAALVFITELEPLRQQLQAMVGALPTT